MKRTLNYAILACAVATAPAALGEESDCYTISKAIKTSVSASPDNVLAIVEREIGASPACSCEIVKAAIVATEADRALVGQIVSVAVEAAPDQLNVITNCAIAVAPDALGDIQAAVAKLSLKIDLRSSKGGLGAKGAKSAKGGADPVNTGAAVRDPNEGPYLIPGLPPIHPPLIDSTCTPDEMPNIDLIGAAAAPPAPVAGP